MPSLYNEPLRSSSSMSSTAHAAHRRTIPAAPHIYYAPDLGRPVANYSRAYPAFQSATITNPVVVIPAAVSQYHHVAQPTHDSRQNIANLPLTGMPPRRPGISHDSTTQSHYSISGSPHDDDPSTVCLAAMVHEFLEEEPVNAPMGSCGRARCNCVDEVSCGDDDGQTCIIANEQGESQLQDHQHLCEILEGITCSSTSQPELLLLVDVARAVEAESEELAAVCGDPHEYGAVADHLRRPVMKRLREEGYNAAICKSHWKHADGLPAGDYEYIDIVVDMGKAGGSKKSSDRFIVDIDFKAQFEIARASKEYVQLLCVLPRLFVGRAERLNQILKIMSNAAKCSLKKQGLLLPPWRKHKYVQAKWFSPYRRTTNAEPLSPPPLQISRPQQVAGPNILSLDFTKEMDVLFYKAQADVWPGQLRNTNYKQHMVDYQLMRAAASCNRDLPADMNAADAKAGACNYIVRAGFMNYSSVKSFSLATGAMCTDWQLPTLDDKCQGSSGDYKVSGISTALRQSGASLLPCNQPNGPRLAMVS